MRAVKSISRREIQSGPELDAPKAASVAGDRTSIWIRRAVTALSTLMQIAALIFWSRWAFIQHLLRRHGLEWIALITVASIVATVIHECGHAVIAWCFEMKLHSFKAGPFQWASREGSWAFKFNATGLFTPGGSISAAPTRPDQPAWEYILMIAAGPAASLLFGAAATWAVLHDRWGTYEQFWQLIAYMGAFCLIGAVLNLIPFRSKEGGYSDGARIVQIASRSPRDVVAPASAPEPAEIAVPEPGRNPLAITPPFDAPAPFVLPVAAKIADPIPAAAATARPTLAPGAMRPVAQVVLTAAKVEVAPTPMPPVVAATPITAATPKLAPAPSMDDDELAARLRSFLARPGQRPVAKAPDARIPATPAPNILAAAVKQGSTPKSMSQAAGSAAEKLVDSFARIAPAPAPSASVPAEFAAAPIPADVEVHASVPVVSATEVKQESTQKSTLQTIAPVAVKLSDPFDLITPAPVPSVPVPAPIAATPVVVTPAGVVKQESTPTPQIIAPVVEKLSVPFAGIAPALATSVPASVPIAAPPAAVTPVAEAEQESTPIFAPHITAPIAEKLADVFARIVPAPGPFVPASASIASAPATLAPAAVVKQESTPKPTLQIIAPVAEELADPFAGIAPAPAPSLPASAPIAATSVAVTPSTLVKQESTPKPTLRTIAPAAVELSDSFAGISPAPAPSVPVSAQRAAAPTPAAGQIDASVPVVPSTVVKQESTPKPRLKTIAPVAEKLSDTFAQITPAPASLVPVSAPIAANPVAGTPSAVAKQESIPKPRLKTIAPVVEKLSDTFALITPAQAPLVPVPAPIAATPAAGVKQESATRPRRQITARIAEKLADVFARLAPAHAPLTIASAPVAPARVAVAPTAAVTQELISKPTPQTTVPVAEKLPEPFGLPAAVPAAAAIAATPVALAPAAAVKQESTPISAPQITAPVAEKLAVVARIITAPVPSTPASAPIVAAPVALAPAAIVKQESTPIFAPQITVPIAEKLAVVARIISAPAPSTPASAPIVAAPVALAPSATVKQESTPVFAPQITVPIAEKLAVVARIITAPDPSTPASAPIAATPVALAPAAIVKQESTAISAPQISAPIAEKLAVFARIILTPVPSTPASAPIAATSVALAPAAIVKQESTPIFAPQITAPIAEKLAVFARIIPAPAPSVPATAQVAATPVAVSSAAAVRLKATPEPTPQIIAPVAEKPFARIAPAPTPVAPAAVQITAAPSSKAAVAAQVSAPLPPSPVAQSSPAASEPIATGIIASVTRIPSSALKTKSKPPAIRLPLAAAAPAATPASKGPAVPAAFARRPRPAPLPPGSHPDIEEILAAAAIPLRDDPEEPFLAAPDTRWGAPPSQPELPSVARSKEAPMARSGSLDATAVASASHPAARPRAAASEAAIDEMPLDSPQSETPRHDPFDFIRAAAIEALDANPGEESRRVRG